MRTTMASSVGTQMTSLPSWPRSALYRLSQSARVLPSANAANPTRSASAVRRASIRRCVITGSRHLGNLRGILEGLYGATSQPSGYVRDRGFDTLLQGTGARELTAAAET